MDNGLHNGLYSNIINGISNGLNTGIDNGLVNGVYDTVNKGYIKKDLILYLDVNRKESFDVNYSQVLWQSIDVNRFSYTANGVTSQDSFGGLYYGSGVQQQSTNIKNGIIKNDFTFQFAFKPNTVGSGVSCFSLII
jgi:hypothetical protein